MLLSKTPFTNTTTSFNNYQQIMQLNITRVSVRTITHEFNAAIVVRVYCQSGEKIVERPN